jgi:hypothetical protein
MTTPTTPATPTTPGKPLSETFEDDSISKLPAETLYRIDIALRIMLLCIVKGPVSRQFLTRRIPYKKLFIATPERITPRLRLSNQIRQAITRHQRKD